MYLLIGDYHANEKDLDDCERLAGYILAILARNHRITPVFLGDLYDTHSVIRAEVQRFWYDFFEKISSHYTIVISGNHDRPTNQSSKANALLAHSSQVELFTEGEMGRVNDVVWIPYCHDPEEFVRICNFYKDIDTVICHQTFQGAQYENGFYAKDGVDQNRIPQAKVISGHIHSTSTLGKVFYPGAPRWRTLSDAKQIERYLYLTDGDFNILEKFPTSPFCSKTVHYELNGKDQNLEFNTKDRYFLDIKGPIAFIKEMQDKYRGKAKIRIFEEKESATLLTESDPLDVSVNKWLANYKSTIPDFQEKIKNDGFFRKFFRNN